MSYLALDLGTTTGWAFSGSPIISSVQSFQPSRFEGGGMRYLRFTRWLDALCADTVIARLAFEEVRRHAATDAAHVYGGFMATLTAWCEANKVPYEAVPVGTIKKHATGKGNASKSEMIEAARRRGHSPKDDNEADALAILYWMLDTYGTPSPAHHRLAPHRESQGRVQVGVVRLPRRPVSR